MKKVRGLKLSLEEHLYPKLNNLTGILGKQHIDVYYANQSSTRAQYVNSNQ